ncbi:MAG: DUF1343 domain-containing protein [Candidatus Aminicenantes bacterium]|nr:DUF1343 domain-containing protein [Candidatus Aminicenantes bacterium]MDH5704524.1 DUF1343 domain-containing protein [Candidatus Aminicenantes bacterium]
MSRQRNTRKSLFCVLLSLILSTGFLCPETPSPDKLVKLGNEIFLNKLSAGLKGKSLGLVLNHTSVLPNGQSLLNALQEDGHKIQAIFSPEHGFSGKVEAGKEVKTSQFKGIPVYSLYGETRKPTAEQLQDIDAIIFDIQDVGARFYTYISTLKYLLEAAAQSQIPVYVLDRPNPVGGEIIEGPLLQPEFESFIGALPIPIRYGMTSGELAMMMKGEGWVAESFELHIVRMNNWRRSYFWKDTGLLWNPTSPNMPSPETAIIYPGSSFFGAVKINEGGGTLLPFLQFGAPWLDPSSILDSLGGGEEFGIQLEAVKYTPRSLPGKLMYPIYENRACHGLQVIINQEEKFLSIRFALAIIRILREQHPDKLSFNSFDINRMYGNELFSRYLEGYISYEQLLTQMEEDEETFRQKRKKYLLYE